MNTADPIYDEIHRRWKFQTIFHFHTAKIFFGLPIRWDYPYRLAHIISENTFENTFRGHLKSIFASTTANCFLSGPKGWETRSLMSWRVLDNRLALHFSLFSPMVCVALISISRRASIELKTIGGVNARISLVELGCRLRARTYFGIEWQPLRT